MQVESAVTKLRRLRQLYSEAAVVNERAAEQNCLAVLQSCDTFPKLTQAQSHIIKSGLTNNPLVLTKFAATSGELKAIDYASSFLFSPESDTRLYDAFLFNTVIRAYARSTIDSKSGALSMYGLMLEYGVLPNRYTFPFVLKACAGIPDLNSGKSVHGSVLKLGFDDDVHVRNTLVHMYCCDGEGIDSARKVFDEMPKSDCVTWSAMIGGYARLKMSTEAILLFRQMQSDGIRPDEITMVAVLTACTDLGSLELGRWVESCIEKEKIEKNSELYNALIDMFAKCGDVDKAINLFRNMNGGSRTVISWTSVIVGLAMHGRGLEALSLFEEMVDNGVNPDGVVFIALISACTHSGLVDRGRECFDSMERKFKMEPKIEHYGCMVDMFCRAGKVKEAFEFVREMPIEPNPIIWRTLINACRSHGELKLGEEISAQLIRNDPMYESNYVLLSNIYAKMSDWEMKRSVREVMEKKGMKKIAGSTVIEMEHEHSASGFEGRLSS
ncbi:Pentatricopeptide repeat-containing protein At2g02980, chloroplastic [Linum perenne]